VTSSVQTTLFKGEGGDRRKRRQKSMKVWEEQERQRLFQGDIGRKLDKRGSGA